MRLVIAAIVFILPLSAAFAQSRIDTQFRAWLAEDLWPEARRAGISQKIFNATFEGVAPDLKLPDLVMPGEKPKPPRNQHQAEFGAPGAYFRHVGGVTSGGRARLSANRQVLAEIERRYGVPAGIVLAIWGRESGFGTAKIPHDAVRVLATKAFMATRKELFRTEILAALTMIERGMASPRAMRSSWAGAMGQPQFLPSSYLAHAVDHDGDGRPDIWNSVPDTLASIASYLDHFGWVKGRDWGFEVVVPERLSCALEGPDRGRSIAEWEAMGVRRVNDRPFPENERRGEGFLMMPAGRNGPAFIVTPNFYVLKKYNESDLYALFVGHAADRIAHGDRDFVAGWGRVDKLLRSDIAAMQRRLEAQGYDVGGADGLPGFRTRRSLGEWQQKAGMPPTCFPSTSIAGALR